MSLDQAGYLPIPVQKGERGQKIDREEKEKEDRGDRGMVEGTCSLTSSFPLPPFSLRSPLRMAKHQIRKTMLGVILMELCLVSPRKKGVNIQLPSPNKLGQS